MYDPETKHLAQDPKPVQEALFYDRETGVMEDVDGNEVWPTLSKEKELQSLAARMLTLIRPGWEERPDMQDTPRRFASQLQELTSFESDWKFTTFPAISDEMITLGPIPFYTLCAHHVIPFFGKAYVGYVPNTRVAGLSKIPRLINNMAKGLWMQEELTTSIAETLEGHLEPHGVAVMLEGEHMCMAMRGVRVSDVITTTSAMRGVFADHSRTAKAEFMEVIRRRG